SSVSATVERSQEFLGAVREVADGVAASHADDVDRAARFPREAVDALRSGQALSALVPASLGGAEVPFDAVAAACRGPARRCGATGMVFAMHQIQVATIVRHLEDARWFAEYLRDLATDQRLIASVTSEVGTGGDLSRSIAPVETTAAGLCTLDKLAPT